MKKTAAELARENRKLRRELAEATAACEESRARCDRLTKMLLDIARHAYRGLEPKDLAAVAMAMSGTAQALAPLNEPASNPILHRVRQNEVDLMETVVRLEAKGRGLASG